jgi:hypothetical protein
MDALKAAVLATAFVTVSAGLIVLAFAHGLGWLAFLVAFAGYAAFMLRS